MKIPIYQVTIEDYHTDEEILKMVQSLLELNRDKKFVRAISNSNRGIAAEINRFVIQFSAKECE